MSSNNSSVNNKPRRRVQMKCTSANSSSTSTTFQSSSTSSGSSYNTNSSGSTKKSVAGGGAKNPLDFMTLFLFHVCKKPLLLPIHTRVSIYFVLVAIGSVLFDFFRPPPTFLANRRGVLNLLFVKYGWGWTLACLAPFTVSTSFIYTAGRKEMIRHHLLRLLIGTVAWYVVTAVYRAIENVSGQCLPHSSHSRLLHRTLCERGGGVWMGFDISGHVFLLILCNLWIAEESQVLRDWSNLGRLLDLVPGSTIGNDSNGGSEVPIGGPLPRQLHELSLSQAQQCRRDYHRLNGGVKSFAVALCLLSLLWDLMLVATVLYFHNMPSKFTAMLCAFLVWFLAYRCWFKSNRWSPGQPGDGPIRFITQRT